MRKPTTAIVAAPSQAWPEVRVPSTTRSAPSGRSGSCFSPSSAARAGQRQAEVGHEARSPRAAELGEKQEPERPEGAEQRHLTVLDYLLAEREHRRHHDGGAYRRPQRLSIDVGERPAKPAHGG
jgi:hypothetical protein